jgi:hypothetical protein
MFFIFSDFTFSAVRPAEHKVCVEQLIVQQETLFHFQEMLSALQDFPVLFSQFPEKNYSTDSQQL